MTDPRIKQTIVRDPNDYRKHLLVSTCNTSDHGLETMIFRVEINWSERSCERYNTVADAIAGHDATVARLEADPCQ